MPRLGTDDRAVIVDSEQERAAVAVRKADDRLHQLVIASRTLELDGVGFAAGDETLDLRDHWALIIRTFCVLGFSITHRAKVCNRAVGPQGGARTVWALAERRTSK